jgi:hypothetical protein
VTVPPQDGLLDESLSFHSLFSKDMKQAARERLTEFGLE